MAQKKFNLNKLDEYQGPRRRIDKDTTAIWDKQRKEYRTYHKQSTSKKEASLTGSIRFTYFSASMGLGSKVELIHKGFGVPPLFFSNNLLHQQIWTENGRAKTQQNIYDYLGPEFEGWIPKEIFFYLLNEFLNLAGDSPDRRGKLTKDNYEFWTTQHVTDFRRVYPNYQWRWEIGWIGYITVKGEAKRYEILKASHGHVKGTPPNRDPTYIDLRPKKNGEE